jgi:tRNA G18 (ribose-2'-O)-methylase SpoU
MRNIVVIAHNLRSSHNVGSLLRTADGLGAARVYLTGYTPYPTYEHDLRLPYLAKKINQQIAKTALGVESSSLWEHQENIETVIQKLKASGYTVCALEQTPRAISLPDFEPPEKVVLIIGREVEGLEQDILEQANLHLQIPMLGNKESLNVVQAAAIAMYHCRYFKS